MEKYKADPFYAINLGKEKIVFNYFGEYETDNAEEIEALNALCPKWIKCVSETVSQPEKEPEVDEDFEPEHVGGGYYLLSNGEKIKGKDAAIKAEAELEK